MKKLFYLVTIVASIMIFTLSPARSAKDRWDGEDKILHLGAGFGLHAVSYSFLRCFTSINRLNSHITACSIAMSVGISKEFYDEEFSYRDLVADAVGVCLSIPICSMLDREQDNRVNIFLSRDHIIVCYEGIL